jgi:hypothetical protein
MALTSKNTSMNVQFIKETSRGAAVGSGQLYRVSDAVENVNLVGRNNGEVVYSVYDYDGQGTIFGAEEYVLTFDYYLQRNHTTSHPSTNSIEYYALTRSSGNLSTLEFIVHTDSNSTYRLNNGVINTWSLTPEEKRIKCSAEILFSEVTTTGMNYHLYTAAVACGTTFEQFQGATCTRTGSFEAGVSGFTMNINNNADRIPVLGSSTPTVYESLENLGGTVDILLNDGGNNDWGEMTLETKQSIVFQSGTSTTTTDQSMKWTFTNAHFSEVPIPFTTDTRVVQSGITWGAETVALTSVT